MVDLGQDGPYPGPHWVCPDDRQLALRGKLSTGWCMRAYEMTNFKAKGVLLSEEELNYIKNVVLRADEMDIYEKDRIGRLFENLERLKRNLLGDGIESCILCGESFRFFGTRGYSCVDCSKMACRRCRIMTTMPSGRVMNMCKICSETKEIWRKSGAWLHSPLPPLEQPDQQLNALQRLRNRFRNENRRSSAERRPSTDRRLCADRRSSNVSVERRGSAEAQQPNGSAMNRAGPRLSRSPRRVNFQ